MLVAVTCRLRFSLYAIDVFKVLTVALTVYSGLTKNSSILRMYTVVQLLTMSVFYYFGGKLIYRIMLPAKRGQGMTDEAWEKQCEPATKIRECSKRTCIACLLYIFFQCLSVPTATQNKSPTLAYVGFVVFTLSISVGGYILVNFFQYCCFGSRKSLRSGKVHSFGAASSLDSRSSSSRRKSSVKPSASKDSSSPTVTVRSETA